MSILFPIKKLLRNSLERHSLSFILIAIGEYAIKFDVKKFDIASLFSTSDLAIKIPAKLLRVILLFTIELYFESLIKIP